MNSGRKHLVTLISGGVRSGKSRYALQRAMTYPEKRYFVATAEVTAHSIGSQKW